MPICSTISSVIPNRTQPPEGQIVVVNVTVWSNTGNIEALVAPSSSCGRLVVGIEESESEPGVKFLGRKVLAVLFNGSVPLAMICTFPDVDVLVACSVPRTVV